MTVREAVIGAILRHHPKVASFHIHTAHPLHPFSGDRALRRLKEEGVEYEFKWYVGRGKKKTACQHYDFSKTKKRDLKALLKGGKY